MARILFYLPNVTSWWFNNVVGPLARLLAREHEVHIMVPPEWHGTGLSPEHLEPFADGPQIAWHILDGDDNPSLRDHGTDHAEVRALAAAIDPDYTLCRCADPEAIHAFPGTVRFIMEGAAAPFANGGNPVIFTTRLFEFGALPPLDDDLAGMLENAFADIWADYEEELRAPAAPWRPLAGVAPDRRVVAVPLEYELAESFTVPHRLFADNQLLVARVAAAFDDDVFLAFTNHPVNELHADNSAIEARIAALGDRAALIRSPYPEIGATDLVACDCDGAVLDLSKSHLVFGYYGVPMIRPVGHATAPWLNMATDLDAFAAVLRDGRATPPCPATLKRWFAFHIANSALDLTNRSLTAAEALDFIRRPINPDRWARNLDVFRRRRRRQLRMRALRAQRLAA
jgi:hypothetical protein